MLLGLKQVAKVADFLIAERFLVIHFNASPLPTCCYVVQEIEPDYGDNYLP